MTVPESMSGAPSRGVFVVLDGLDGCGKTTQATRLTARLTALGREVLHVRDPGGTDVGERIRGVLLDPELGEIVPVAEVLLYQAARAQLAQAVIEPALAAGRDVVCERWHYATRAYQGAGGGATEHAVDATSALATAGTEPDRAVLLRLPVEQVQERLDRALDRIEQRGEAYRGRVAAGFDAVFALKPAQRRVVHALGTPDEVEARLWNELAPLFAAAGGPASTPIDDSSGDIS